ncbi:condensin-2 complex subunit D3 [Trichomycterus rosablanca]|uniref:condensin-2 complex subunit D3 n=1 Tax=Trichomycterus rosablanca TaxID=2290929 RepID=UPI002F35D45D
MELVRALQLLKLNSVPTAWVDTVWDCEFTDVEPLDSAILEDIKEDTEVFKKVHKQLLLFSNDEKLTQSVWNVFGENDVSVRSLMALLASFILGAKTKSPSVEQRRHSLQAASLYLLLLKIPGSIANKVFHQILFDTCLDVVLKCWPQSSGKKRKKDFLKSSQGDAKSGKRSKPPKKVPDEMDIDEEEEEEVYFSAQDLLKIREDVISLMQSLLGLLEKFSLKGKPQTVDSCVRLFTELANLEPVVGELTFTEKRDADQLQSLPELAYYGLGLLCFSNHGEGNECRRRVFHKLLYVILMMRMEGSKSRLLVPSQAVCNARDQAVRFISQIVTEQAEVTLPLLSILLQHICHQMVEKAEYRASGSQAIGKLVSKVPCQEYAAFVKWLHNYSLNSRVAFRMFALDVAMALLAQEEREVEETLDPELDGYVSHRFLVRCIVYGRRSDVSPTVRAHSMHCLAQCLELPGHNASKWIHELFLSSSSSSNTDAQTLMDTGRSEQTLKRRDTVQKTALTFRTIELSKHKSLAAASRRSADGMSADATATEYQETLELFKQRVSDPKSNVRKCALETITSLLKHGVIFCSLENLSILSERSRDPAVSVRKKALQCLMDLLAALPDQTDVQEAWLRGVVPAVMDQETSVQEKALECLNDKIISQIKSQGSYRDNDISQRLAWDLLALLSNKCQDLKRYFSKAISIWLRQQKFSAAWVNSLIWHTERERAACAWFLLAKVASNNTKFNLASVVEAWDHTVRSPVVDVATTCHIITVISHVSVSLNEDTKSRIVDDLMAWLKGFTLPLEVTNACVDALFRFGRSENVKDTMSFLDQYCGELVSVCESYLSSVLLKEEGVANLNEDLLIKHLYTLGAASLHCPAKVKKRVFLLVQAILTPSEQPDGELPASQPLSQFKPSSMPTVVRAHAVVTLGKLCLQHEDLMLCYMPAFVRELEVGTEVAVRNNVVVVLCDLCVRYPNTLSHYISNISACLGDSYPIIRKQSLIMLTNLLREEFIKWKGSLFFRFAAVLVDPDPAIADLCEYCLVDLLQKRNPLMFFQHFIECIFHFNSYEKHKKYNRFPQTDSEKKRFSLKGLINQGKRFRIYRFLLKNLTDEQRFKITTRICQDVLTCFVESELPLDSEGAELLADVFDVLSLKEIKLVAMSGPAANSDIPDDEMAVKTALQKKLVSQVQKKNFVENVIPIIIALKNLLEEQRSPVLKHLMSYLQVTMQDYRSEVKELFAADEQLAAEVEHELKMFEKRKEQEQELEQQLSDFSLSPRSKGNAAASSAAGGKASGGFSTPVPAGSARRPSQTPKSADALRRRTFAGMQTPVGSRASRTVMSLGPSEIYDRRAISTPQESMNEVTFGEQLSAICFDGAGRGDRDRDESIVHLMSPERQAPAPRQWNVESPAVRKTRGKKRQD